MRNVQFDKRKVNQGREQSCESFNDDEDNA